MGDVRLLQESDLDALLRLCASAPVENVFVASRVARFGVERRRLGCDILGFVDGEGHVVSALHVGANLVPVQMTPEAGEAFLAYLGGHRSCSSIMGPQQQVLALFQGLGARHRSWQRPREVRREQPLLMIDGVPAVAPDRRVEPITMAHFASYYEASVRMYTEEVGVSPVGADNSYADHVRRTIREGRAFGIVEGGRVVYKSDVGADLGTVCQIQGVWLAPELRGRGLAPAAMAGVVHALAEKFPVCSLYVNDFNAPAIATYARVGFHRIGTFSTVLY